jgi:hypothetical protein
MTLLKKPPPKIWVSSALPIRLCFLPAAKKGSSFGNPSEGHPNFEAAF